MKKLSVTILCLASIFLSSASFAQLSDTQLTLLKLERQTLNGIFFTARANSLFLKIRRHFSTEEYQTLTLDQLPPDESQQVEELLNDYREISRELIDLSNSLVEMVETSKSKEDLARIKALNALRHEMQAAQTILLSLKHDNVTEEYFETRLEIFNLWEYVSDLLEQQADLE